MWQHCFFPLQVYGDFFRRYGQLTPQSIVKSCRISHSSELLCMPLLPASMKRIGCKTVEKKWRHRFPPLYSYGSYLLPWKPEFWLDLAQHFPTQTMLQVKFDCDRPAGPLDIDVWTCLQTDRRAHGQTDGRGLDCYPISSTLSLRLR